MTFKIRFIRAFAAWLAPRLTAELMQEAKKELAQKQRDADNYLEHTRKLLNTETDRCERHSTLLATLLTPLEQTLDNQGDPLPWDEQDQRITTRYFRSTTGQRLLQHMLLHSRRTLDSAMFKQGKGQQMVDAAMGIRLAASFVAGRAGVRIHSVKTTQDPDTFSSEASPDATDSDATQTAGASDTAHSTTAPEAAARKARLRDRYRA